uniref:hydroxymethylglutaryl-CoA lyase n=1 Tax=Glossina austeni TaxID=7395 RepID=A0A1A9VPM7_GLOAU
MVDNAEVYNGIKKCPDIVHPVLTPNEGPMHIGAKEVAIFRAASDTFPFKNEIAHKNDTKVRGYVSTVFACLYEGPIKPLEVKKVVEVLDDMGCYEFSLADTIDVGTSGTVSKMLDAIGRGVPPKKRAVHFHDTYSQVLANVLTFLKYGRFVRFWFRWLRLCTRSFG